MLYFVATPIGNLKDITLRAIEVLKSVDLIACEDTRRSLTLLNHYEIKKPLVSYHKFNERESGEKIITTLKQGKNVAVISDAGMPVISDPGNQLVNMLIENNLEYTVVPGASAFTSALVLSQADRKELLQDFKEIPATLIFYSAPHDVKKDIQSIYEVLGNRKAAVVKEISKIHEKTEWFELKNGLSDEPRGEYVILVEKGEKTDLNENLSNGELIEKYISEGVDKKQALKIVAKERGVAKSELYKYTIGK